MKKLVSLFLMIILFGFAGNLLAYNQNDYQKAMTLSEKNKAGQATTIEERNLINTNLRGRNLSGFNLSGANLSGANLYKAILRGTILADADLVDAYLVDADLFNADLVDANLSGANLNDAKNMSQEQKDYAKQQGALNVPL